MRLLLDTDALVWFLIDRKRIPERLMATLVDPANLVYVNAAAVWEATVKVGTGKLSLRSELEATIRQSGFSELPVTSHMPSKFDICRSSTASRSIGSWSPRPCTRA